MNAHAFTFSIFAPSKIAVYGVAPRVRLDDRKIACVLPAVVRLVYDNFRVAMFCGRFVNRPYGIRWERAPPYGEMQAIVDRPECSVWTCNVSRVRL